MSVEDKVFKDQDEALQYTQSIRKSLVDNMCQGGQVPQDKDSRITLLAALGDMDKQTLQHARLKQDDKNSADDRAIAERIAMINRGVQQNPSEIRGNGQGLPERQVISDGDLADIEMVDGETTVGIANDNMTEFLGRVEN